MTDTGPGIGETSEESCWLVAAEGINFSPTPVKLGRGGAEASVQKGETLEYYGTTVAGSTTSPSVAV